MTQDFVVAHDEAEWSLSDGQERFGGFGSEQQALRLADMLARDAHLSGAETRVLVRDDHGELTVNVAYR